MKQQNVQEKEPEMTRISQVITSARKEAIELDKANLSQMPKPTGNMLKPPVTPASNQKVLTPRKPVHQIGNAIRENKDLKPVETPKSNRRTNSIVKGSQERKNEAKLVLPEIKNSSPSGHFNRAKLSVHETNQFL